MNAKKLEKSLAVYEQVKQLDKEIIEIDRFAMLVANGEIKSSFDLKIEDIGKQKEDEGKVKFDSDGDMVKPETIQDFFIRMHPMPMFHVGMSGRESSLPLPKNKHQHSMKVELTENATLQILGVLLYEKQTKRAALVKQLNVLGVNI